jgi:hypothetical protein
MTPWDVIEDLYDSEINVGLQADWDGGITVWIGGPQGTPGNEVRAERAFGRNEFGAIAAWLDAEAKRLFPPSTYPRK